jgi:hypothetical protein
MKWIEFSLSNIWIQLIYQLNLNWIEFNYTKELVPNNLWQLINFLSCNLICHQNLPVTLLCTWQLQFNAYMNNDKVWIAQPIPLPLR